MSSSSSSCRVVLPPFFSLKKIFFETSFLKKRRARIDRGERGEQEYDVCLFEFWIFGSGFRTNREKKVKTPPRGSTLTSGHFGQFFSGCTIIAFAALPRIKPSVEYSEVSTDGLMRGSAANAVIVHPNERPI